MENYQEKQAITPSLIRDLVKDLRLGLSEEEIARKYGLALPQPPSESGEKQTQLTDQESFPRPSSLQTLQSSIDNTDKETEESSFICPTCLTAFAMMFDICPNCSASVQESIGRCEDQPVPKIAAAAPQAAQNPAEQQESGPSRHHSRAFSAHQQIPEEPIAVPAEEGKPQAIPVAVPSPKTERGENLEAATLNSFTPHHIRNQSPKPHKASGKPHRADRLRNVHSTPLRCESCASTMTPALRDIYDRSRGVQSLIAASLLFLLSYLSCILLGFLDTPSVPRLTVFFTGCLCLMLGSILTAVGAFMYLAREKVYFCTRCKRTYPRADISYLTAALVWSSKRAGGSL